MKKLVILIALFTFSAYAQEITKADLDKMRQEAVASKDFAAKQNVITNGSISAAATSRKNQEKMDTEFSYVIRRGSVTNQERSGRCWLFAGLNVARFDAANEMNIADFEFSENYLFFYHKLELANYILDDSINGFMNPDDPRVAWALRNGLSDGGYWGMFTNLADKYGAVPKSVMPETKHSGNTGEFNDILDKIVKRHTVKIWDLRKNKATPAQLNEYRRIALSEIYKYLALTLGTPPDKFVWRYRDKKGKLTPFQTYTPKEFAARFIKNGLNNKVHLMNDPSIPYDDMYKLKGLKNVVEEPEERFLNVRSDVMIRATKRSIIGGRPVWFGADVMKYADIKGNGTLDMQNYDYEGLLGFPVEMNKRDRLRSYASSATHAMVFFGVDLDKAREPQKWLVENSWGPGAGAGGYLYMTNEWFQEFVFDVIVDRDFVDPEIIVSLDGKVHDLPVWHHLWRPAK